MTDTLKVTQVAVEAFVSDIAIAAVGTLRVSQLVIEAFVSDAALPTQNTGGPNTGTPVCHPYRVHLDRKCRLLGSYNAGTGRTTWTLPIADSTLVGIVLASSAFTGAGGIPANGLYIVGTYSAGTVYATGDYSAGYAIVGRPYTMSVELSRPYRRNIEGVAIVSDRLQHTVQYFSHHKTGDYTIRASMAAPPTRADRSRTFAQPLASGAYGTQEQGETRTLLSGWAEQVSIFVESALPRPCTISAIKYGVDVTEDQG